MKIKRLILPCAVALLAAGCNEDISSIGSSLTQGEINIVIDSIGLDAPVIPERAAVIDSRSTTCLVGRFDVEDYGKLECNFVARMMAASSISFPDSIGPERVDSMKLLLRAPRNEVFGDSLAPQQIAVYKLDRQLPSDITNAFDPTGYYDPEKPLAKRSYVLSALGMDESYFNQATNRTIPMTPGNDVAWGRKIIEDYRTNPDIFAWPSSFAEYFPGLYVEQTFGRGCLINIGSADFNIYYHTLADESYENADGETVTRQIHVPDSIAPFALAPEVLSSNNITYTPSPKIEAMAAAGKPIVVSPAGYICRMTFPTRKLVDRYFENDLSLGIVSDLTFFLPAENIDNGFGITPPPYLLMVKANEYEEFFSEGKLPDSETSFYATYSAAAGGYSFSSMRDFIRPIVELPEAEARAVEDTEFVLVPVQVDQESYTSSSTGQAYTILVRCVPYIAKPSMVLLKPEDAEIVFTFSYQQMLQ